VSDRLFLRLEGDLLYGPEANVPGNTLQAFGVGPELRQHVSHILLYRETLPHGHEALERVVPDGAVRLVFNLGDAPSVGESAGLPVEAVGASTQPALVRLRRRMEGLSVTLRPGAAAALLGVPAGEIAGGAVPLDELWHGDAAEALERLMGQPDDTARVAVLHAILQRRLRRTQTSACPAALRAARLISTGGGQRKLRDVAEAIGVGERRLQQLFRAHVGLSPRAWSRLSRLHHCLRALRLMQEPHWAELAQRSGFYDQAHLANEFRALCGLTPSEFFAAGNPSSGSSKTAR
jgi:AraC-like DNA-binding protein